jgi:hypothetical protein
MAMLLCKLHLLCQHLLLVVVRFCLRVFTLILTLSIFFTLTIFILSLIVILLFTVA